MIPQVRHLQRLSKSLHPFFNALLIQERLPDIVKQMKKHDISLQTIYNNSACLAQFTDVTP